MCDCRKQINEKLSKKFGVTGEIINYEMISGRTYSTFEYVKGKKKKEIPVLHTYCPSCGQKYDDLPNSMII